MLSVSFGPIWIWSNATPAKNFPSLTCKIENSSSCILHLLVWNVVNTTNVQCRVCLFSPVSLCLRSVAPARQQNTNTGTCTGSTKGQACNNRALPFTQHCFQRILSTTSLMLQLLATSADEWLWFLFLICAHVFEVPYYDGARWSRGLFLLLYCVFFPSLFSADILLNRSQQLFASCTAKFADGQQCSIPVFDITHQTPLCEEHAKKMVSSTFKGKVLFFFFFFTVEKVSLSLPKGHTVHRPAFVSSLINKLWHVGDQEECKQVQVDGFCYIWTEQG